MSDRTTVKIIIPTIFKEEFELAMGAVCEDEMEFSGKEDADGVSLESYLFHEKDGSELEFEGSLDIPYSKYWDAGYNYDAGEEHVRIDAGGNSKCIEFDAGKAGVIDFNLVVEANKNGDLDKLLASHYEEFNVLSWQEQIRILNR